MTIARAAWAAWRGQWIKYRVVSGNDAPVAYVLRVTEDAVVLLEFGVSVGLQEVMKPFDTVEVVGGSAPPDWKIEVSEFLRNQKC